MNPNKKNKFQYFYLISICLFISIVNVYGIDKHKVIHCPLSGLSELTIEGPHRFLEIGSIKGLHIKSLDTKAYIETDALNSDKGCISFWMSPLEDFSKSPRVGSDENIVFFSMMSDSYPLREVRNSNFSVYYQGTHYPRVIGRFTDGKFWSQMDYGLAPFVYAEELPVQKGQWYHFVVTWDKAAQTLTMFINGIMVGHNYSAITFKKTGSKLYIGNPLMVISNLKIYNKVLSDDDITKEYNLLRPESNAISDQTIQAISIPGQLEKQEPLSNKIWKEVYRCNFKDPDDLNEWTFQTGDLFRDKFKLETTQEGLYWETPDTIHTESRGYLWSPVSVEGDQCIEYEFQLVSPKGLALVIWCASGIQGEDIIDDHGLKNTGAMGDMLINYRNYHWEYVRRVEAMRTDVETQYVNKNPWGKSLFVGCVPRLEQNKWYKLRIIKEGNRLIGSLNNEIIFNVGDNPYDNNGPVMNSGRVVLRQMYHTAIKYRNFVIYKKIHNE